MKKTALNQIHIDLGAKMVPFAGYDMPVQYKGVNAEHQVVREGVGVFDVSHMGEFMIEGPKALDLLQRVSSNDVSKLFDGKAQYAYLPNHDGGVVDDFLTYRIAEDKYYLVVNASNIEKDWNWIKNVNDQEGFNCKMTNLSDETSLLAIQGPKAIEAMQSLTNVNLSELKYYTFTIDTFAGIENVMISATGYTGSGGFEIYVDNKDIETLWKNVFEAGAAFGIEPIGLAARDTLRLEMGFCLYGNDIDDNTSPLEAGLGWVTKFTKDFINSANLQQEKEAGVKNKLIGFELIERGIPRKDYLIVDENGNEIGRVTSGTQSPSLQKAIGLGYVTLPFANEDQEIFIQVRNKNIKAKVVKTPFYKK